MVKYENIYMWGEDLKVIKYFRYIRAKSEVKDTPGPLEPHRTISTFPSVIKRAFIMFSLTPSIEILYSTPNLIYEF